MPLQPYEGPACLDPSLRRSYKSRALQLMCPKTATGGQFSMERICHSQHRGTMRTAWLLAILTLVRVHWSQGLSDALFQEFAAAWHSGGRTDSLRHSHASPNSHQAEQKTCEFVGCRCTGPPLLYLFCCMCARTVSGCVQGAPYLLTRRSFT